VIGAIIAIRNRHECRKVFLYLFMSISLFISYLLAGNLPFKYLISYEREDFVNRILLLSVIFALPLFLLVIYGFLDKLLKQNKFIKFSLLIFSLILVCVSLYLSYPRFDHYFNSHGYSTSASDIKAVHWINNDAKNNYIVLADQQVSAAALREYGFSQYYRDDIFYYPIPTGGPMYQYYLNMVYDEPSSDTMHQAMDLAGVKIGYFVLNKYWWAFAKIMDEAKQQADSWNIIDDGEVYIFKYHN
jgi:hypothetical protein